MPNPTPDRFAVRAIAGLPRLRAVLRDVLGVQPDEAHLHLDLAEGLACDDRDRAEVVAGMRDWFGITVAAAEAEACESIADLLRMVGARQGGPASAYA